MLHLALPISSKSDVIKHKKQLKQVPYMLASVVEAIMSEFNKAPLITMCIHFPCERAACVTHVESLLAKVAVVGVKPSTCNHRK